MKLIRFGTYVPNVPNSMLFANKPANKLTQNTATSSFQPSLRGHLKKVKPLLLGLTHVEIKVNKEIQEKQII